MDLPADVFIELLTYLPFQDVISVCQSNSRTRYYCTDVKYNAVWKRLIDSTFKDTFYYTDNLEKIWKDLGVDVGTYNYLVYTKLVKLLDPITQLRIYYKQGDMESFDSDRFSNKQRFLAYFLLGDKVMATEYLPGEVYQPFLDLMDGKDPDKMALNWMMLQMVVHGSPLGVSIMYNKGAKLKHVYIYYARDRGYLGVLKYLEDLEHELYA